MKVLKAQGTWQREQKPLLDEYVYALCEAASERSAAEASPYHETDKGLLHPHPGFQVADRATRRALQLADSLLLTPAARRTHGLLEEGEDGPEGGDQAGL